MDDFLSKWATYGDPIFRWLHVVAGIMWIGHLWFFNFVNSQLAKTYDADSKKKVLPELMPRALYWFRWGAMYTWIFGIVMLGLNFTSAGILLRDGAKVSQGLGGGIAFLVAFPVGFFIYDALWKALGKNEMVAAGLSYVLIVGYALLLAVLGFSGRAVFIHVGATFGSTMMMNVWMRIWPGQRKIIAGVKGTAPAPDAAVPAVAGLRSKHNTYMSVPLVLFMLNSHFVGYTDLDAGGFPLSWLLCAIIIAVGWGLAKFFYVKSATPAPATF